jgi:transcriptional regulator with XRE-family HTH domain
MGEVQKKLGFALRVERERRGLSLENLSQQLKISESNLQSIEDGDPAALPGELYFKMFARSYAESLGIDYERTIEAIREELGQAPDANNNHTLENGSVAALSAPVEAKAPVVDVPVESLPKGSFLGGLKSYLFLGVMAIVVVGLAFILFGPRSGKFGFLRIGDANSEPALSDSADDGAETDAGAYRVVAGSKDAATLTLEMVARDRTWATVIADSDTALHYNLKPWREYVIGAQEKLIVSVVSPLSVDMKLNGIAVDFSDPEKGTVQNVEVTNDNMSLFIKRAATDSAGLDTASDYVSEPLQESDSVTGPVSKPPDTGAARRATPRDALRKPGESRR